MVLVGRDGDLFVTDGDPHGFMHNYSRKSDLTNTSALCMAAGLTI